MSYLHIENLYRPQAQNILLFKECYALEKIHGSSSHLRFRYNLDTSKWEVTFFAGGESHDKFISLFNQEKLLETIKDFAFPKDGKFEDIICFGEVYAGRCQGMSHTYGKNLSYICFDIRIGDKWLSVPDADLLAQKLGLEFVPYKRVSTELSVLDAERDAPSVIAVKNAEKAFLAGKISLEEFEPFKNKKREGIVLRPIFEVTLNNGSRLIAKHKGADFSETKTPRPIVDPTQMKILSDAQEIANEWITARRLEHVLQRISEPHTIEKMRDILSTMREDVYREGAGEIVQSKIVDGAISKKTAEMFKEYLNSKIGKQNEPT